MPRIKKRVNVGDSDEHSQPKKSKVNQVEASVNVEERAYDLENDPRHTESQEVFALTRKRVAAKSNEVLSTFESALQSRKETSMGGLRDYAKTIEAKENELREATATILARLFQNDGSISRINDTRQQSAVTVSTPLKEASESNITKSKTFLEQYRSISWETTALKGKALTGGSPKKNVKDLDSLLNRHCERLQREIHTILRDENSTGKIRIEDKSEEELWDRFGAASAHLKSADVDGRRYRGSWIESTKNSTRALQRLVKYIPEEK